MLRIIVVWSFLISWVNGNCKLPDWSAGLLKPRQCTIKSYKETFCADILSNDDGQFTWLQYADGITQYIHQLALVESLDILHGRLHLRPRCNDKRLREVEREENRFCEFFDEITASDVAIRRHQILQIDNGHLTVDLYSITALVIRLFNRKLYLHAKSMAAYVLDDLIPLLEGKVGLDEDIVSQIYNTKLRCLLTIQETLREQGLESADEYCLALQVVQLKTALNPSSGLLLALRKAVAIPSMPPTPAESSLRRSLILQNLQELDEYILCLQLQNIGSSIVNPMLLFEEASNDISVTPFYMPHQGLNDYLFQVYFARVFGHLIADIHDAPNRRNEMFRNEVVIPIGFVSAHFFSHSIGNILIDTIVELSQFQMVMDHNKIVRFEVFVYFLDSMLNSTKIGGRDDVITQSFRKHLGDNFRHLPLNITLAKDVIRSDNLQFLMFTDLGMEMHTYALAFARLAFYQAAWWGHPVTSGMPSIDFFFGLDDESQDAGDTQYSEQLIRMQYINTIPYHPERSFQAINKAETTNALQKLAFPSTTKIYLVLGRIFKLHPDFIDTMADLLIALHELEVANRENYSVLVFFAEKLANFNQRLMSALYQAVSVKLESNTSHRNSSYGADLNHLMNSILRRVKIVDYEDYYFALLQGAHAVLDTFPYGGCISSHDAFYYGIPVVTLPGDFARGRFTLSLYRQMGLMSFVAKSPTDFVAQILKLHSDSAYYTEAVHDLHVALRSKFKQNTASAAEWARTIARLLM